MKHAKSFPLENDEGEGGWSHKGYRKEKKHRNFSFLCQYFNCSVNRTIETDWQNIKICLAELEVVSVKLCNFLNYLMGKKKTSKILFKSQKYIIYFAEGLDRLCL